MVRGTYLPIPLTTITTIGLYFCSFPATFECSLPFCSPSFLPPFHLKVWTIGFLGSIHSIRLTFYHVPFPLLDTVECIQTGRPVGLTIVYFSIPLTTCRRTTVFSATTGGPGWDIPSDYHTFLTATFLPFYSSVFSYIHSTIHVWDFYHSSSDGVRSFYSWVHFLPGMGPLGFCSCHHHGPTMTPIPFHYHFLFLRYY